MTVEEENKLTEVCSALDGLECYWSSLKWHTYEGFPIARVRYVTDNYDAYICKKCLIRYLKSVEDAITKEKDGLKYMKYRKVEYL